MNPHTIVQEFFKQYPQHTFAKGQTVLLPSPELPPITLIESGVISQYAITETGNKAVVNIFKAGAFFPASSAVNHTPTAFYFEASADCVVRQAPAGDVEQFLQREPTVVYDLLQRVYRGTDGVLGRLAGLLGGAAEERLLYEIQINARRFGTKTPTGIEVVITEAQLAQQTGLARETVSRELKKLRQKNIVTQERGRIEIKNEFLG